MRLREVLFFLDSLGKAERVGRRQRSGRRSLGQPHHDFHKNVAGAMEVGVWVGLGVGHSLPSTNSDFPRSGLPGCKYKATTAQAEF